MFTTLRMVYCCMYLPEIAVLTPMRSEVLYVRPVYRMPMCLLAITGRNNCTYKYSVNIQYCASASGTERYRPTYSSTLRIEETVFSRWRSQPTAGTQTKRKYIGWVYQSSLHDCSWVIDSEACSLRRSTRIGLLPCTSRRVQ